MADKQPAYIGATYNADIYKSPSESLGDYLVRLSRMRSAGVLGGGGMFDSGPNPTVTTPNFYDTVSESTIPVKDLSAAAAPLGVVVQNTRGGNYQPTAESVRISPEDRMANDVAIQAGVQSDIAGNLIGLIPTIGTPLKALMDYQRESNIRGMLEDKAIDPKLIDEIINNPDYAAALVDTYNKGGLSTTGIPTKQFDVNDAGSAVLYNLSNVGDSILKGLGIRDTVSDPWIPTVTAVPDYLPQLPTLTGSYTGTTGMLSAAMNEAYQDPNTDWANYDPWSSGSVSSPSTAGSGYVQSAVGGTVTDRNGNPIKTGGGSYDFGSTTYI